MDVFKTAEDILNEKGSEILSISPDALIAEALTLMTEKRVGSILIQDENNYIGIWTERDLMINVQSEGFDIRTAKMCDYMNQSFIIARHGYIIGNTRSCYSATILCDRPQTIRTGGTENQ